MSETEFQKQVLEALGNLQGQVSGIATELKDFKEKQEIFNEKQEKSNEKQEIFNAKQEAFNKKQEIFNEKQEKSNEKQEQSIDALFRLSDQAFSHISDIRAEVVSPWKIRQSKIV